MSVLGFHRIAVWVTHEVTLQYNVQKVINVPGMSTEHAKENAKMYFVRLGYYVNGVEYLSIM